MHTEFTRPGNPVPTALIVNVESSALYEIGQAFRGAGYRTFGALSFMEAKRILMAERPEVLVADVRLGEFNGIQLLMLGKSVTPGLRAVITNATADRVLAEETHRLGATFMIKPLDCRDLLRAVDNTTRHRAESTRHVMDRRLTLLPHFGPEHRFGERRVEARVNRRAGDRRRVIMPILFPDRRLAERRHST